MRSKSSKMHGQWFATASAECKTPGCPRQCRPLRERCCGPHSVANGCWGHSRRCNNAHPDLMARVRTCISPDCRYLVVGPHQHCCSARRTTWGELHTDRCYSRHVACQRLLQKQEAAEDEQKIAISSSTTSATTTAAGRTNFLDEMD